MRTLISLQLGPAATASGVAGWRGGWMFAFVFYNGRAWDVWLGERRGDEGSGLFYPRVAGWFDQEE